nr:TetR family transcriptional regulator [Micromonospora sp. DSM 115978]
MPRAGLSRDRVVAEAAALADTAGLDAVTLSTLADRLGVRVPSLYKHVDSLDDLR